MRNAYAQPAAVVAAALVFWAAEARADFWCFAHREGGWRGSYCEDTHDACLQIKGLMEANGHDTTNCVQLPRAYCYAYEQSDSTHIECARTAPHCAASRRRRPGDGVSNIQPCRLVEGRSGFYFPPEPDEQPARPPDPIFTPPFCTRMNSVMEGLACFATAERCERELQGAQAVNGIVRRPEYCQPGGYICESDANHCYLTMRECRRGVAGTRVSCVRR